MPSDPPESRPPSPTPGDDRRSPSDPKKLARPGPVTWSMAVLVGMGFLVVVSIFDRMRNLRSVATRDAITDYLSKPPGSGLGLDVETVLQAIHVASVACATLAGAAAVLACWLPTRQRSVRLGLTLIAPPLLITGVVADGFGASLMAAAVVVLWMPQARDWYAGRAPAPIGRDRSEGTDPTDGAEQRPPVQTPQPAQSAPAGPSGQTVPPPAPMSQDRATLTGTAPNPAPAPAPVPVPSAVAPDPYAQSQPGPWSTQPWSTQHTPVPRPRPSALVLAVVLTWLFSSLGLLLGLSALIAVRGAPEVVLEEWATQRSSMPQSPTLSDQTVIDMLTIVCVAMIIVSLIAVIVAGFVFARQRWAAYTLAVLSLLIGLVCLVSAIGGVVMLVPAVAAFSVAILLRQRVVRDWLDGR